MVIQFSFIDESRPAFTSREAWERWLIKLPHQLGREVGSFIYEMPSTIIALAVAGVASSIFFPLIAGPCLAVVCGTVLSRLVVKFIDKHDRLFLLEVKNKAIKLNEKYPNIMTITLLFATIIGLGSPALAWMASMSSGAFKGMIIEIEIHNQNRKRPSTLS